MYDRIQLSTRLIATEGPSDKIFVEYLKNRFNNPRNYIKIEHCFGSTPHDIISKSINYIHSREYFHQYIFMDTDKKIKEEDKKRAANNNFQFIFNNKCLEATILQLIEQKTDWSTKSTHHCKMQLKKHIDKISTDNLNLILNPISNKNLKDNSTIKELIKIIQND